MTLLHYVRGRTDDGAELVQITVTTADDDYIVTFAQSFKLPTLDACKEVANQICSAMAGEGFALQYATDDMLDGLDEVMDEGYGKYEQAVKKVTEEGGQGHVEG